MPRAKKAAPRKRAAASRKVRPPRRYLDVPIDQLADLVEAEAPSGPASKPLTLHPLTPDEALRRAMRRSPRR